MQHSYLYIMASKLHGTLYIGVTADLVKRVYEHRTGMVAGFTKKYHVHMLVYYEMHEDITQAIQRETQMKAWKRRWKIELIEKQNPAWEDLYASIL
ncbi:MAG: hypothetical protein DI582_01625 [Azospirillum brasilense]|nr:MAG: hypothetical protein DI582_01625 [Azospirillum brasilense]